MIGSLCMSILVGVSGVPAGHSFPSAYNTPERKIHGEDLGNHRSCGKIACFRERPKPFTGRTLCLSLSDLHFVHEAGNTGIVSSDSKGRAAVGTKRKSASLGHLDCTAAPGAGETDKKFWHTAHLLSPSSGVRTTARPVRTAKAAPAKTRT